MTRRGERLLAVVTVLGSFALCLAIPALWPALLDHHRAPRALALALPVPLALFATAFLP